MNEGDRKKWLETASTREIEEWVDAELRHKNKEPYDYLSHWCSVARHFAYATRDTSWGEFEKLFSIIIKRLVVAERKVNEKL